MDNLKITLVDDDCDLWLHEEPPEPVITVTFDGGSWIVYGDEDSEHPLFSERWWPAVLYGGGRYEDEARDYAKKWARAVRGSYQVI